MPFSWRTADVDTCLTVEAELWVLFVAEDERPLQGPGGVLDWRLSAGLSRWMRQSELTGAAGEQLLYVPREPGAPRVLTFGLGPTAAVPMLDWSAYVQRSAAAIRALGLSSVVVVPPPTAAAEPRSRLFEQGLSALSATVVGLRPAPAAEAPADPAPRTLRRRLAATGGSS
jgi:hypothetical protein